MAFWHFVTLDSTRLEIDSPQAPGCPFFQKSTDFAPKKFLSKNSKTTQHRLHVAPFLQTADLAPEKSFQKREKKSIENDLIYFQLFPFLNPFCLIQTGFSPFQMADATSKKQFVMFFAFLKAFSKLHSKSFFIPIIFLCRFFFQKVFCL